MKKRPMVSGMFPSRPPSVAPPAMGPGFLAGRNAMKSQRAQTLPKIKKAT